MAVYHDDFADYSTNECTMDGTACLVYYMSELQSKKNEIRTNRNITFSRGAVVRMDTTKKEIWLTFTAHEFTDGFDHVLKTLSKYGIKASFFLTGDFCRGKGNDKIIERLKSGGHYIGPHSDKHLLYCSWEKRDSLLVSRQDFINDLECNYTALQKFNISKNEAQIFLPPYEWYNDSIAAWTNKQGVTLVNMSSGTNTNQDWTIPEKGKPYFSSDSLMQTALHNSRPEKILMVIFCSFILVLIRGERINFICVLTKYLVFLKAGITVSVHFRKLIKMIREGE